MTNKKTIHHTVSLVNTQFKAFKCWVNFWKQLGGLKLCKVTERFYGCKSFTIIVTIDTTYITTK